MNERKEKSDSEIILYQTPDGNTEIDVRLENETVWLNQTQMVELFQTTKQNISLHVKNVFEEGELREDSTVKEYLTAADGDRNYLTNFRRSAIIRYQDKL